MFERVSEYVCLSFSHTMLIWAVTNSDETNCLQDFEFMADHLGLDLVKVLNRDTIPS